MVSALVRRMYCWWFVMALLLAFCLVGCGSSEVPPLGPDVVLLQVEGGTTTVRNETKSKVAMVTDTTEVIEGDTINVGVGSRAYLVNGGGHVLLLTAGAELKFIRFFKVAGTVMREIVVGQDSGTILFSIPELPDGMFFQMRAGEVAVLAQGPAVEFGVSIDPNGIRVKVFSGNLDILQRKPDRNVVEVQAKAGDIAQLSPGTSLSIVPGQRLIPDEEELLTDLRNHSRLIEGGR